MNASLGDLSFEELEEIRAITDSDTTEDGELSPGECQRVRDAYAAGDTREDILARETHINSQELTKHLDGFCDCPHTHESDGGVL